MTIYMVVNMVRGYTQSRIGNEENSMYTPSCENVIHNINRFIKDMKDDDSVFFIRDVHDLNDIEFPAFQLPEHCLCGTKETEIDSRLWVPVNNMCIVNKPTMDAYYCTSLDRYINMYSAPKDKAMVVMGCRTEYSVFNLALQSRIRGYEVAIPENCVATNCEEAGDMALQLLNHTYGVRIV